APLPPSCPDAYDRWWSCELYMRPTSPAGPPFIDYRETSGSPPRSDERLRAINVVRDPDNLANRFARPKPWSDPECFKHGCDPARCNMSNCTTDSFCSNACAVVGTSCVDRCTTIYRNGFDCCSWPSGLRLLDLDIAFSKGERDREHSRPERQADRV